MSYEGGGMKLGDLAGSSRNPTSFVPAFHVLWSRFRNRETARLSRKSYESVPRLSPTLRPLTLLQQATMVPVLSILHRSRHPGPPITVHIRAHRNDRDLRKRTCPDLPPFLYSLIFEQTNRKVYREVLIAGDLSNEDAHRIETRGWFFLTGRTSFDTVEFIYGNDTIYFAQPIQSQFVPGGSGPGTFNQAGSIGLKGAPANSLESGDRSTPKSDTGVVLRYGPPTRLNVVRCPDICLF